MKLGSKENCTACGNCLLVCRKNAIFYERDDMDNHYPKINNEKCKDCGLCSMVCPSINKIKLNKISDCYVGWSNDERIRKYSASGGIASSIYSYYVNEGNYFVAVKMNEKFEAHFYISDSVNEICYGQNSKYTFSYMNDIVIKIGRILLNDGRVVFIGLPCQVAAVKKYLNIQKITDEHLLTVDLICHGIPSDEYLKQHIRHIEKKKKNKASTVYFRDAKFETNNFVFSLENEKSKFYKKGVKSNDIYQIGYHSAAIYRPNCYACSYSKSERSGDLTIGDFAGLGKKYGISYNLEIEKTKGVSCILVNTERGQNCLEKLVSESMITIVNRSIEEALFHERQLKHPSIPANSRSTFIKLYKQSGDYIKSCDVAFKNEIRKNVICTPIKKILKGYFYKLPYKTQKNIKKFLKK